MRVEVKDKNSGAILFKKTKETKTLEVLVKEVESLKKDNTSLKKRLTKLENMLQKEDS